MFHLNAGPIFFSDLVVDIVYRKIAAAFFCYLVSFKLNLKLGHCCSVLGQETNQKRFQETFYQCIK